MAQLPLLAVVGAASNLAAAQTGQNQGDAYCNPLSLVLVFDVTFTGGAAPTLQLILEAFDPVSGKFIQWGTAFTAVGATGTFTYVITPNVAAASGGITATLALPVPNFWRVRTVAGGTIGTVSYTVTGYTISPRN